LGAVGFLLSVSAGVFSYYHSKLKDRSTLLLVTLLVLIGLTLLEDTINISGIANRYKNLYFLPLNFSLSIAPLLYLFVKSKIQNKLTAVDFCHLIIPTIQFAAYAFIGFQNLDYKTKLWENNLFRAFLDVETVLFVIGLILYSFLSYNLINHLSTGSLFWKKDVKNWLLRLVKVFFLIASMELVILLSELVLSASLGELFYVFRSLIFVILIAWLVYNTLKLLHPISIYKSLPKVDSLDIVESKKLQLRLDAIMNDAKIYLNSDLSLEILSQYLDISEKRCSRFFSTTLQTNFKSYINNFRVLEFKKRISSGKYDNLTILGIAFDSGFDSKTTFNRVFKKAEGITPSEFKKTIRNGQK